MELKYIYNLCHILTSTCSNRTFMELKLVVAKHLMEQRSF